MYCEFRKFFLDAVPMTSTSEGIHFMTQLITTSVVTGVKADMWMTTLAFIQNPTLEMLNIVKVSIYYLNCKPRGIFNQQHVYCCVTTQFKLLIITRL